MFPPEGYEDAFCYDRRRVHCLSPVAPEGLPAATAEGETDSGVLCRVLGRTSVAPGGRGGRVIVSGGWGVSVPKRPAAPQDTFGS